MSWLVRCCGILAQFLSIFCLCVAVHAGEAVTDDAPRSPFLSDATLQLYFRNYAEHLGIAGSPDRDAWVQGVQVNFESGYTAGWIGVGLDASLFAALKLNGGIGARNMVHVGPEPDAANRTAWAYPGRYALKARLPTGAIVKYGLQTIVNPFLEAYDIRALPPTYRGVSLTQPGPLATLTAGRLDAVNTRGATRLQALSTSYGGVEFDTLSYVGSDWKLGPDSQLALYANRAQDLWDQYYLSVGHALGKADRLRVGGQASAYFTRNQGAGRQGRIDNKAYSTELSAQHRALVFFLAYQRVLGEQFYDFTGESCGIYLANAMGNDFNAPHERSVQLRMKIDGNGIGAPGLQLMLWKIRGWGADGSAGARIYAAPDSLLHGLYWKAGVPVGGGHTEYGLKSSYTLPSGTHKGANIALLLVAHDISQFYPSKGFRDARLMVNVPVRIF